ncbi:MAG: Vitamin B12 dependent methionine synthase activation subunit [Clostridia bacterium]|nr:Vitamin B12 dependent methionine synthase activation subunit [Clostridia bacterium]
MISVKKYENLPIDLGEIARYMGCKRQDSQVSELLNSCIKECNGVLSYNVCFDEFPISISGNTLEFPFAKTDSRSISRHLDGFSHTVVFAATVGIELDRLIMKYSRLSPSRALCFQAIGAERIEALCDAFCEDLKLQNTEVGTRFSPGYGDFPLSFQTEIFKVLDLPRKIGLSLNSALLMSPTKSVTAIVGVK